jgi:iron uptake system EfeUOB component EfeO/EfeM
MKLTLHLLGVACALLLVAGGCGDDDNASTAATEAPESRIAPDAEVSAGLRSLVGVADAISKASDKKASEQASKGLEPVWMKVEGTVKKNEPDMYATIEEDLSLLESGAQAKTRSGAAELSKTVDAYLAKHPG